MQVCVCVVYPTVIIIIIFIIITISVFFYFLLNNNSNTREQVIFIVHALSRLSCPLPLIYSLPSRLHTHV